MKKIKTLLKAPVLTQSGYGVHSRQIFDALANDPLFDLHVENIKWGACSFLTEDTDQKKQIKQCIERRVIEKHKGDDKFDLFVHVTIPNEFEKLGSFNIAVTAGIETDRVSHTWIQKCNEMDLIIVPSEHSKKGFVDTIVGWEDKKKGTTGEFKLETPIVVCNEGVDSSMFRPTAPDDEKSILDIDFKSSFNFLHVGQWGRGGYGEDRKNIANLVRYFCEAFRGRKDVGLVLKVNMARSSVMDYDAVRARLDQVTKNFKKEDLPPIYLLHGNLSNDEMVALYNHPKIKAFISLTHGEGYGLPLIEAASCDLPVLATNWSGHLDFLKGNFVPISYEMVPIPDAAVWADILIKGSNWAEVKPDDVKNRMKKIVKAYSIPKEWATNLGKKIRENFDVSVTNKNFTNVIKQHLLTQKAAQINPEELLRSYIDDPNDFNAIYTMPMSAGDVYISSAVIDGLMKEMPEGAKLYFATNPQYETILEDNPNVHKVIEWNQTMMSIELLEKVFDVAFTPNVATQYTFSNWVRKGQGRLLAQEFANHCHSELGDYFIKKDDSVFEESFKPLVSEETTETITYAPFITLHTGSGKGQWEARKYVEWQEVANNLKELYPDLKLVQVGGTDEPELKSVDLDLRGKTTVQQLASVIEKSKLHLSIDTFSMHLAAGLSTPIVALFGSSHARSTGPWVKNKETAKFILLEAEEKMGCDKACYKYQCAKNREMPCVNEIEPAEVVESCARIIDEKFEGKFKRNPEFKYKRIFGTVSGYTTTFNLEGYPFRESIQSMLGFCDEVVVVDGVSTDGTWEALEELAKEDDRIKLFQNPWDFSEPGIDGLQKAFARYMCEGEFLWQQDCDEVVHERDYEKIKLITKRFPSNADILHLPVVELWGNGHTATGRRHAWKWRMSRNNMNITHGINKHARLTHEKTGKVYAKPGMSDGCEYVNAQSFDMEPHVGFWSDKLEIVRRSQPDSYAEGMNEVFDKMPSVYHYSWCSLENKIRQFRDKWDRQWSALYQTEGVVRFPGVDTDEQITELAKKLYAEGGEDSDETKYKFQLRDPGPKIMEEWLTKMPLNESEVEKSNSESPLDILERTMGKDKVGRQILDTVKEILSDDEAKKVSTEAVRAVFDVLKENLDEESIKQYSSLLDSMDNMEKNSQDPEALQREHQAFIEKFKVMAEAMSQQGVGE